MLDRFMPKPRLVEVDHVDVAVPPERAYEVARHFDPSRSPPVRMLFALRTLPDHLRGHAPEEGAFSFDAIGRVRPGFRVMAEEPGRGFVVGAIGRFWQLEIPFVDFEPADFAAFDEPGFAKVAWAIRCEPLGQHATRLIMELRLTATDEAAWKKVRRYFRLIGPFSRFMRRHLLSMLVKELGAPELRHLKGRAGRRVHDSWRDVGEGVVGAMGIAIDFVTPFLRSTRSRWGVDVATAAKRYPGDELVVEPGLCWTHGIELDSPPEAVWPWIAQIGQSKGGFYSYQWLENLCGCEIQNARRVHSDWTKVRVGDELRMHPGERFGSMPIVAVQEGRWLVAHACIDPKQPGIGASWLFYLEPLPGGRSRLISRFRSSFSDTLGDRLMFGYATEAIGFVMDRRMLLGIKERVERAA